MKNECAIAVFARAPIPGEAKTRLIPRLGAQGAAQLHERLVEHTLATAARCGLGPIELWCAGALGHAFFQRCERRFKVTLASQSEGDLGARMLAAFRAHAGHPVLLVGTDCPVITVDHFNACAAALGAGADAVFLPAEDGGYGLVGLTQPIPEIFQDMRWSTEDVMAQTRLRLAAKKRVWREPAIIWDIDRPEDIDRLVASRLLADWEPPVA